MILKVFVEEPTIKTDICHEKLMYQDCIKVLCMGRQPKVFISNVWELFMCKILTAILIYYIPNKLTEFRRYASRMKFFNTPQPLFM